MSRFARAMARAMSNFAPGQRGRPAITASRFATWARSPIATPMVPTKAVGRGLVLALGAAALLGAGGVRAETRVLLVGVGAYASLPSEYRLSVPAHDLARLSSSLIAAGVPAAAIAQVSDARSGEGNRLAILGAIEDLVARTGAGDRVLLYYSG